MHNWIGVCASVMTWVAVGACAPSEPVPPAEPERAGAPQRAGVAAEPSAAEQAAVASGPLAPGQTPELRPTPRPLVPDPRPIDRADFAELLNPRHPELGLIHATPSGGCHVYVGPGDPNVPGLPPPPTPVPCPPELLDPAWGHCTGADAMATNAARDACICIPGLGDPPWPAFRVPCPGR